MNKKTVGIVGARGHTGAELIRLIARHPQLDLAFVSSRELAGQSVSDHIEGFAGTLRYENLAHDEVAKRATDAVILALPNGKSAEIVAALQEQSPATVIVDLSADHRFSEAWYYGLPELTRGAYAGQTLISNPGCYATAMQLAIAPLLDHFEFVDDRTRWGSKFRFGLFAISDHDMRLIAQAMEADASLLGLA
jgi:N-acetyl-gamma-glutamyl-phosphate reductase